MADIVRDDNRVPVVAGVSNIDGTTPVVIAVNPDTDGAGTHCVVVEAA